LKPCQWEQENVVTSNSAILWPCISLALCVASVPAQVAIPPRLVSATPSPGASGGGQSYSPLFSGDGRYLIFISQANNLVTNDSNATFFDVFARDLVSGVTSLVSVQASGAGGGNGNSSVAVVSSNGLFIAFQSAASNLVTNDNNGTLNVYVRDVIAQTTALVSIATNGTASGNGRSSNPEVTPDGRWW